MTGIAGGAREVLVVGAGPTGLLLASELERRGVRCLLIDAKSAANQWDRATVVHPRSLEIFESLGLAQRFLDAGTPQRGARLHSGGEVLGGFELSASGSSYPFSLGVSEEVTESILTDYLHQQGGEVQRSSRLIALTQSPGGVRAEIERDGERYDFDAQWVVGCDGLHSPTRLSTAIEYEGHDIAEPWAVFDVTLDGWPEVYDLTFAYLESPPVILTALPGRRWRVYLRPTSAESDLVADAASTLGGYYPEVSLVDVENPTRFHCHSQVATHYRAGRVLLAGDAAHLCSPAQGHGMNTGLHDAANLAWKLALVHHGLADPALLDSYEVERRPVAAIVADEGDAFEHALIAAPSLRAARDASLRATFGDATSRHHEVVAEAELNIDLGDSPIVAGDAEAHLAPGQRLPDTIAVVPADGAGPARLHQHTHRAGHTLVLIGAPRATAGALTTRLDAVQRVADRSPRFDAVVAFGAGPELPPGVGHLDADASELLGVGEITVLAVRPDGFVGLRADDDHLAAVERYDALLRDGGS